MSLTAALQLRGIADRLAPSAALLSQRMNLAGSNYYTTLKGKIDAPDCALGAPLRLNS